MLSMYKANKGVVVVVEGNSLCKVENLLSSTTTLVIIIPSRDLFYYLQISCSPTHVSI